MTSNSVPDTSPRKSSVPSTEGQSSSVPSTKAPKASVPSTIVPKKDIVVMQVAGSRTESNNRNVRLYEGQPLGVRHWDGTIREIAPRFVPLATVSGHIVNGMPTKHILDRAPWSALEIVEID